MKAKAASTKVDIINKVLDCPVVPWGELKKYEANRLKAAERRNVAKLKAAILSEGFSFPLVLWRPNDGVTPPYVIDGAGRIAALTQLEKEGGTIPDLPVVFVSAESREQAKKLVALCSSQFGVVDKDSFGAFVQDLGGLEAVAPLVSISSTIFATDYFGPVVGPGEDEPKKKGSRNQNPVEIPEFELGDLLGFGNHDLMVGAESGDLEKKYPLLKKVVKFIRKEFPELEITRNGEAL